MPDREPLAHSYDEILNAYSTSFEIGRNQMGSALMNASPSPGPFQKIGRESVIFFQEDFVNALHLMLEAIETIDWDLIPENQMQQLMKADRVLRESVATLHILDTRAVQLCNGRAADFFETAFSGFGAMTKRNREKKVALNDWFTKRDMESAMRIVELTEILIEDMRRFLVPETFIEPGGVALKTRYVVGNPGLAQQNLDSLNLLADEFLVRAALELR